MNSIKKNELDERWVRENFDYYSSSTDFRTVDAVMCSFPSAICEAFIPLNKTIIFSPAHRYNLGRCTRKSWTRLNENYSRLKSKSKLIVAAMSRYDFEYQAHYTGIYGYQLYAHGTFYASSSGQKYEPSRSEILVGPTNMLGDSADVWLDELRAHAKTSKLEFVRIREAYPNHYELTDLAQHPAIVIFPYAVMSYSIVDYYAANLPMFVPSIHMLVEYRSVSDRSVSYDKYCGEEFEGIEPSEKSVHGEFNPNSDDEDDYR